MKENCKGIVFDYNGTLFWDTQLHIDAWMKYCAERGIPLTIEDFYRKVHGKTNEAILKILFDGKLSPEESAFEAEEKERMYREICVAKGLQLAAGVEELLDRLKEVRIPFTIATASYISNVQFFYEFSRLDRWFRFEDLVFLDGKIQGKPSPAMYLKAMQNIKCEPKDVLIFEDSPPGIQAAQAAQAGKIILVNSDGRDYSAYPYEVIQDFHEVLDRF